VMMPPLAIKDSVSMNEKSQLVGKATPSVAFAVPSKYARTAPVMVKEARLIMVLLGSRTMT